MPGCLALVKVFLDFHTIVIIWVMMIFLYSSSVYCCHLFLISSASVRSIPFLSYRAHLCMKCSLGISNFLEENSSLSHSVIVLYFFALITEEGFLISSCYSLELCIQIGISFPFPSPLASLLFTAIARPPKTTILLFCIAFLGKGLDHCLLYNVMKLCP